MILLFKDLFTDFLGQDCRPRVRGSDLSQGRKMFLNFCSTCTNELGYKIRTVTVQRWWEDQVERYKEAFSQISVFCQVTILVQMWTALPLMLFGSCCNVNQKPGVLVMVLCGGEESRPSHCWVILAPLPFKFTTFQMVWYRRSEGIPLGWSVRSQESALIPVAFALRFRQEAERSF